MLRVQEMGLVKVTLGGWGYGVITMNIDTIPKMRHLGQEGR